MQTVFVIGAARSGTTLLAKMLGAHPAVVAGPETHLFNNGVNELFDNFDSTAGERPDAIGLSQYLDRPSFVSLVRSFCDTALETYRAKTKPNATTIVEKTPFVATSNPAMELARKAECYPDARFLHIVRDPRAVVRSLEHAWFGSFTVAEAAELWRRSEAAVQEAAPSINELMHVSYERLVAEPEAVMTEVFEWLGLPVSRDAMERVLNATKYRYVSREGRPVTSEERWHDELTAGEVAQIESIAGPLMTALGYERVSADGQRRARTGSQPAPTATPVRAIRRAVRRLRMVAARARDPWGKPSARFSRALHALDDDAFTDLLDAELTFHHVPEPPGPTPTGDAARAEFLDAVHLTFRRTYEAMQWSSVDTRDASSIWFAGTGVDGERVYVSLLVRWHNRRATAIAWLDQHDPVVGDDVAGSAPISRDR